MQFGQPHGEALSTLLGQVGMHSPADMVPGSIIAQSATITATGATTAAAQVVTTATQIVQPTVGTGGGGGLRLNPFDAGYLLGPPRPPVGLFAWVSLALMLALLGLSIYFLFYRRPAWKKTNPVLYKAVNKWAPMGVWAGAIGLLLLLFRVVSLDFFNLRIWLYIWLLATIGAAAYFYYWYRTTYPAEIAKYQKTQRAKQYAPGPLSRGPSRPLAGPSKPVVDPRGSKGRRK